MRNILDTLFGSTEKELNGVFILGKQAGFREGKRAAYKERFEDSSELSDAEYKELIEFLVSRNLELCYDLDKGGFRVRKLKTGL